MTAVEEFAKRHGLDSQATDELHALIGAEATTKKFSTLHSVPANALESIVLSPGAGPLERDDLVRLNEKCPGLADRYVDLGLAAEGGMGIVRWLLDRDLNRVVAMKIMRHEIQVDDENIRSFIEEAQVTAQLSHPAIVPIHELGRLPDGRLFFTMKAIRGRTFRALLQSKERPTLYRLIDTMRRACEAIAYAHSRGVVHRDIKPENIMVGDYGEVLVVDWGLALLIKRSKLPQPPPEATANLSAHDAPLIMPDTSVDGATFAGTPAYMAPEQVLGPIKTLGPPADVYALGVMLYEILTGRRPHVAHSTNELIHKLLNAEAPPVRDIAPHAPEELVQIASRALSRNPGDRFLNAGEVEANLANWLEGAQRQVLARNALENAKAIELNIDDNRNRLAAVRSQAQQVSDQLSPFSPPDMRSTAWKLEDQAERLEVETNIAEAKWLNAVQSALTHAPTFPEAHAKLASYYKRRHTEAERLRHRTESAQLEVLLRSYDDGQYAGYLNGIGTVSIHTRPAGAKATLYRYADSERRLKPHFVRELGRTPLSNIEITRGSYLIRLEHAEHQTVEYPIYIDRSTNWTGIKPGDTKPTAIIMPQIGELEEGEAYVPAGPFFYGGDPLAEGSPLTLGSRWIDAFVVRKHPVTNAEYLEFLNDLVAKGRAEETYPFVPQERAGKVGDFGAFIYGRSDDGFYHLQADADGDIWRPTLPVFQVDWFSAAAFAKWKAQRTGQPWRLLTELEWEKAARGVDRRLYPWGDRFDPTFCHMRHSHLGPFAPADVGPSFDRSPYGVFGMAGNMSDWCADTFYPRGPAELLELPPDAPSNFQRTIRGGGWTDTERRCRCAFRDGPPAMYRFHSLGFRICRAFDSDNASILTA